MNIPRYDSRGVPDDDGGWVRLDDVYAALVQQRKPVATEVWYVIGEPGVSRDNWPTLFATKLDAEIAAREWFPDEAPDKRYARVMYRNVIHLEGV